MHSKCKFKISFADSCKSHITSHTNLSRHKRDARTVTSNQSTKSFSVNMSSKTEFISATEKTFVYFNLQNNCNFRLMDYTLEIIKAVHDSAYSCIWTKETIAENVSAKSTVESCFYYICILCSTAFLFSYKLQSSCRYFENNLTGCYKSWTEVGLKNPSQEFARIFLPHIYAVLRKEMCNFTVNNMLTIGIIADKRTSDRCSCYIIDLKVPTFDINHESFYQSV